MNGRANGTNRRGFLHRTAAAAGGLLGVGGDRWARAATPAPAATKRAATDQVTLGNTGIRMSRLAMGTGTNGWGKGSDQTRQLGPKGLPAFLTHAYQQGVTFFDTADQYGSHQHVGAALAHLGRTHKNDVTLLTKTRAKTAKDVKADLDRFRRELGRDHLDVVLLHCVESANWPTECEGAMEALERAREKGTIRAHGVSCHTIEALRTAARTPWVQVDLARINPAQAHMDSDPETVLSVLRQMKQAGKGVIGMKIFGAGKLAHDVDGALRFASRLDCLDAFTIGFTSRAQLAEVIDKMPRLSRPG